MEFSSKSIAILSDDPRLRGQLESMLAPYTFKNIISLDSVEAAVDQFDRGISPLAILVDLRNDKGGTLSFVKFIAENARSSTRSTLILPMVTSLSDTEAALLAGLGVLTVLFVPCTNEILAETFTDFLSLAGASEIDASMFQSVRTLCEKGATAEAIKNLRSKIAERPGVMRYYVYLSRLLAENGEVDAALELVNTAVKKVIRFPALEVSMAAIQIAKGDFPLALAWREKAKFAVAMSIERDVLLGQSHLASGHLPLAEKRFRHALQVAPRSEVARIGLARALGEQGRDADAKTVLLELEDPHEVCADYLVRASLLAHAHRHREAANLYHKAQHMLVDEFRRPALYHSMAAQFFWMKDWNSAKLWCNRALQLSPQFSRAKKLIEKIDEVVEKRQIPKEPETKFTLSDERVQSILRGEFVKASGIKYADEGTTPQPFGTSSSQEKALDYNSPEMKTKVPAWKR